MASTNNTPTTSYTIVCILTVIFSLISSSESRPQNFDLVKTVAGNNNPNWKTDNEYTFKWDGKH